MNKPLASIILPTYNEKDNIIALIKKINRQVNDPKEIIVVDDNSPDGTSKIVSEYQKSIKHLILITRTKDKGLTGSIKEGIKRASGDIVVWMDCDFSHPPEIIQSLISEVRNGCDAVIASRYVPGGKPKKMSVKAKDNPMSIYLSLVLNQVIKLILYQPFNDWTSGFIAIRSRVLNNIDFSGDYGEYFIDLIYKMYINKYKVSEIPYISQNRLHGESKTGNNLLDYVKKGRKYLSKAISLRINKDI
jgi:dolichol-phosphate mannosyltransferase